MRKANSINSGETLSAAVSLPLLENGHPMTTIVKALLRGRDEANPLDQLDREDLIKLVKTMLSNGVALTFHGKRSALEISRRVRPRVMRREPKLHVGAPD